jgi:hypothetical protein
MNSSAKTVSTATNLALGDALPGAALAQEAGVPFRSLSGTATIVDPIAEWLSLMEVVQMLCPEWPVRTQPMQGEHWKL